MKIFNILVILLACCSAQGAAVIFSGANVKTLKQNIDLNGIATLLSGSVDPSSSATSAPKGSLYLSTSTGKIYVKQDAGSTTNWTAQGAAIATPFSVANGGTGLGTLTLNNVILGNGTSTPNFVAPGTSGNVLTSNGTTWTSAAAAVPNPLNLSYISTPSAPAASSADLYFKADGNLYSENPAGVEQQIGPTATVTDFAADTYITPDATAFGAVSSTSIFGRRVGDTYFFWGTFTPGTSTASTASLDLGTITIDSTKLPSSSAGTPLGTIFGVNTAGNRGLYSTDAYELFYDGSTTNKIFMASVDGSSTLVKGGGTSISNNAPIMFSGSIPVAGWTHNNGFSPGQSGATLFAGGPTSGLSTAVTSAFPSWVTFSNSPTKSVTPTITGTYIVSATPTIDVTGSAGIACFMQIINTSGGATQIYNSPGSLFINGIQMIQTVPISSVYTLTAGNTYVFDIQASTSGSANCYLDATSGIPNYMFIQLQAGIGDGVTSVGTFGTSPNANGASQAGTVLTMQPADATHPGESTSSFFGGGSDGNLTVSASNTTSGPLTAGSLTRDAYWATLTMAASGTFKTAGFKVFAQTCDFSNAIAGAITATGGAGGNGAAAATAGSAGALPYASAGTVGVATVGIIGGVGTATTGTQGATATAVSPGAGGPSGAGAIGGTGNGGAGGAARAAVAVTTPTGVNRYAEELIRGITLLQGGGGAPGGSGAGGNTTAGGGGGGGGSGGGIIYLACGTVIRGSNATAGIIQAKGGAGGNGGTTVTSGAGGGSGGPGGGGGFVYMVIGNETGSSITNAIDVSGGLGGSGGNATLAPGTGGDGAGGGGGGRIDIVNMVTGVMTETFGGVATTGNAHSTITGGGTKAGQVTQANL